MTLDDIMNLDAEDIIKLQKENPRELRKLTAQLSSAAQKRIERAKGKNLTPPAIKSFIRSGGVKSIRGMSINQVTTEFQRVKAFLKNPQSTIPGARKFAVNTAARLTDTALKLGVEDLTEPQIKRLLDVWSKLKERYADITEVQKNYDKLLDFLHDEVKDGNTDIDLLLNKAERYAQELYEDQEMTGGGTSGFFTI